MARRHVARSGDWDSLALRLDEILSAAGGEDPFSEALKLLVGKLLHEQEQQPANRGAKPGFLPADAGSRVAALNALLSRARQRWPGILATEAGTALSESGLSRCAELLADWSLLSADLVALDAIFEHMVSRAAKGEKGQFFTPRHVVAEVVKMMQPRPQERVVDPACGSAGFLRHALKQAPGCTVFGFDLDARACQVARVMMAASGQAPGAIQRADSLCRRPSHQALLPTVEGLMRAQQPDFAGFDLVLTNPPFAGDVGPEYAADYALASSRRVERDVLFIERCVQLLKPGGRLAIVLPHNKVGGKSWAFVRHWLLQQVRVAAVLSLGRNTFQPISTQPGPPAPSEEVLFFISERDGKDERGRSVYGSDHRELDCDLSSATPAVQHALQQILDAWPQPPARA